MTLPELPYGWTWDKVFEIDFKSWAFKIYEIQHFDQFYMSITTQIGPFIWQYKSRFTDDDKAS